MSNRTTSHHGIAQRGSLCVCRPIRGGKREPRQLQRKGTEAKDCAKKATFEAFEGTQRDFEDKWGLTTTPFTVPSIPQSESLNISRMVATHSRCEVV
jgi:hypothetical protein